MINQYSNPVQNTLEQYIPLPFDTLMRAGAATQQRYNAAEDLDTSTLSGIASTETRAAGYKNFVQSTLSNYKNDMSGLIDKYNGRLDDPQFQREQKQVINKYKNDPNWQVIKTGNENIKLDQDIAAKLRAEGKLVINPAKSFTGADDRGNLLDYTPGVKEVNTLDNWENAYKIAHGSMQFDGSGYDTNKNSLNAARTAILGQIKTGAPEVRDLIQAYTEQGLTPEQAQSAIVNSIDTLTNKYGVVKQRNAGYFNDILQREQMNQNLKIAMMNDETRRENEKLKAAAKLGKAKPESVVNTPYAVPVNNETFKAGKDNLLGYVSERSSLPINQPIKSAQTFSGKYFKVDPEGEGKLNGQAQKGGFRINNGVVQGVENIYVTDGGNMVIGGKDNYSVFQKTDPKTGKVENYFGNPKTQEGQRVHKATAVKYIDNNAKGAGKDSPKDIATYYRLANRDEAIKYMGAENAFYEGKNKNNPFNSIKLEGDNNTVRTRNKITISDSKIKEVAAVEGVDEQQLKTTINSYLKDLNTKGIPKEAYEKLREIFDDNYSDEIYHKNVITPLLQNQGKLQAIDPLGRGTGQQVVNDTEGYNIDEE